MNKRQAKKQYKKIHGHNPPSERQRKAAQLKVCEAYGITPEQMQALAAATQKAWDVFARALAGAARAAAEYFNNLAECLEESEDN